MKIDLGDRVFDVPDVSLTHELEGTCWCHPTPSCAICTWRASTDPCPHPPRDRKILWIHRRAN